MSREVELEVIKYNIDDIEQATVNLVTLFAAHSKIDGTNSWIGSLLKLHNRFKNEIPTEWTLNAKGLNLTFSGFPNPIPTIEDERVVFKSREPRFILEESYGDLRPQERTQVLKVTDAIAMEMNEVYHMEVSNYPTTLIFPRDVYAQVERVNAVML